MARGRCPHLPHCPFLHIDYRELLRRLSRRDHPASAPWEDPQSYCASPSFKPLVYDVDTTSPSPHSPFQPLSNSTAVVVHLPIPLLASVVAVFQHPSLAWQVALYSELQEDHVRVFIDPQRVDSRADVDDAGGQQLPLWGTVVLQGTEAQVERGQEAVALLVETAALRRGSDQAQQLLQHDLPHHMRSWEQRKRLDQQQQQQHEQPTHSHSSDPAPILPPPEPNPPLASIEPCVEHWDPGGCKQPHCPLVHETFTSAFTRLLNHEPLPLSKADLRRPHEFSSTFRPRFVLLPPDDGPPRAHLVLPIPLMGNFARSLIGRAGEHTRALASYSGLAPTAHGRLWFWVKEKGDRGKRLSGFGHLVATGEVWQVQRVIDAALWTVEPISLRLPSSEQRLAHLLELTATVPAGQAAHSFVPTRPTHYFFPSQQQQQQQQQQKQAEAERRRSPPDADAALRDSRVLCGNPRCGALHPSYRHAFEHHLRCAEVVWNETKAHCLLFQPTFCLDSSDATHSTYLLVVPLHPPVYDALITQNNALEERLRAALGFPRPNFFRLRGNGEGQQRPFVQLRVRDSLQRCLTVLDFVFHLADDVSEHGGPALAERRERRMQSRLDDFLHGSLRHCQSIDEFLAAELREVEERRSASPSPPPSGASVREMKDGDEQKSSPLPSTAAPQSLIPASPRATSSTTPAASTRGISLLTQPLADSPPPSIDPWAAFRSPTSSSSPFSPTSHVLPWPAPSWAAPFSTAPDLLGWEQQGRALRFQQASDVPSFSALPLAFLCCLPRSTFACLPIPADAAVRQRFACVAVDELQLLRVREVEALLGVSVHIPAVPALRLLQQPRGNEGGGAAGWLHVLVCREHEEVAGEVGAALAVRHREAVEEAVRELLARLRAVMRQMAGDASERSGDSGEMVKALRVEAVREMQKGDLEILSPPGKRLRVS